MGEGTTTLFVLLLGVALFICGIVGLIRGKVIGSDEETNHEYTGTSAVMLSLVYLLVGSVFVGVMGGSMLGWETAIKYRDTVINIFIDN